ncbi:hypothetical protein BDZ89DRAFT_1127583 [Hymenopellis radicata]|nr:hypothetical protein BDZ89DRAFT_1127583 [Hymenopellis radicata]
MSMLVDPEGPPLSQRSDERRHDIFEQAHVRLQDILALVPRASTSRPPSALDINPSPPQGSHTQGSHRTPSPAATNDDPPPRPASQCPSILDGLFNIITFIPLLQRQSLQNIEDEALVRLICGYSDDDAGWLSALEDMTSPYHSHVLDLYSQLNAQENRDLIYRQFLTAQHRDKIHNLTFHVVSFIKRHELLLAFKTCALDPRRGRAREEYVEDIFSRRYKHLLDRLTYHRMPPAEQEQLKKQLSALKRTLKKRFKLSLERADLLAQLYDSFGAAVLLDPFWHFDWLQEPPSFSKGFQSLILHACQNAAVTAESHAQSASALHHVMSVLGDEDVRDIVDERLMHAPFRRQRAAPVAKPWTVKRTQTISGRKDHLWISPVVYNARDVKQRAHEVALETRQMDVVDSQEQTISPNVAFCISEQEHSFTILHGDSLPRIPGPPPAPSRTTTRFLDPELLNGCYWSLNSIPYMGFFPVNPYRVCFNDPLFSCVFQRKWEVPIEKDGENWVLDPTLARRWATLENILLLLRNLLSTSLQVLGSQEHLPAPPPSYYRFARSHPDPLLLAKRLMRARYAFLLLGAEISFFYASISDRTQLPLQFQPALYAEFPNEPLVEAIRDSWLFQPSSGYYSQSYGREGCARHGMFLNAQTSTLAHSLLAYENFCVPVWIWWGNRRHTHTPQSVLMTYRFGFTHETVFRYLTSRGASWQELATGRFFAPGVYKRRAQQRPSSKPLQMITNESLFAPFPEEQWFEFIPRRERAILALPCDRSTSEKIWARAHQAETQGYHPDATLFRWVLNPGKRVLERRRVSPHKAAVVWGEYPPSQRIYCALYDEWDLCVELTMQTTTTHLAWHEPSGENRSETDVEPLPSPSPPRASASSPLRAGTPSSPSAPTTGASLSHSDDSATITPQSPELYPLPSPDVGPPSSDPPEQIIFTPPDHCDTESSNEDGELIETTGTPDWNLMYMALFPADKRRLYMRSLRALPSLLQVLGDFYGLSVPRQFLLLPEDSSSKNIRGVAVDVERFLRRMSCFHQLADLDTHLGTKAVTALEGLCDHISWYARAENVFQQPDRTIANDWLDLNATHPSYVLRDLPPATAVRNVQWRLRAEPTYHISLPDSPFLLQLFRATDVLHFLRQLKSRPYQAVILQLATRGVRFSFAAPTSSLPPPTEGRSRSLPWRRFPFRANVLEYDQYILRRARLFASTSVLRAALMCGGLLWRLAMEHCPDPNVVLACSGEDFTMRTATSRGEVFSEISLTDTDIDIILGVYLVSQECPPPKACLEVSWFPRKGPFNRGGLGVGFWSADAESWYQDRVHGYLSGSEQPVPQADWSSKMKLYKPALRFAKGYEHLARVELDAIAPAV